MGIIEDYLKVPDKSTAVIKGSLIDQYLTAGEPAEAPRTRQAIAYDKSGRPILPISDADRPSGDANVVDNPAPPNQGFPLNPATMLNNSVDAIMNQGKEGALNVVGGLGAKDYKRAGIGALQTLTAIPGGLSQGLVTEPVTQLTGSPDIGEHAGFVASSAIPIAPGMGKLAGLPTSGTGLVKGATAALPKNAALRNLIESIGEKDLPRVVKSMRENPTLGPADLSPKVLQDTQNLFTTNSPQVTNYLKDTSDARMAANPGNVAQAYNEGGILPVNTLTKLKGLAADAQKVGEEQINPAVKGAGPVDISPVLKHIDAQLKPSLHSALGETSLVAPEGKALLRDVRDILASETVTRQAPSDLHQIQSALRVRAEGLLSSATGSDRALGQALMDVRSKIVDAINEASPKDAAGKGTYKPALAAYRTPMQIKETFKDAYEGVLSNSKKMENRPEYTQDWINGLTAQEKEAAKEGVRTRIDTEMNVARNPSLAGTNAVRSEFNKQKMEMLMGKEETATLLKKLDDVRKITNTHNKVVEGSQTAMRSASKGQFAPPAPISTSSLAIPAIAEGLSMFSGGIPGAGTALAGAAGVAAKGANVIRGKLINEHNLAYAKMALPTEGPSRDALINSLSAAIPGPKQSFARRTAGTLSRLVGP